MASFSSDKLPCLNISWLTTVKVPPCMKSTLMDGRRRRKQEKNCQAASSFYSDNRIWYDLADHLRSACVFSSCLNRQQRAWILILSFSFYRAVEMITCTHFLELQSLRSKTNQTISARRLSYVNRIRSTLPPTFTKKPIQRSPRQSTRKSMQMPVKWR